MSKRKHYFSKSTRRITKSSKNRRIKPGADAGLKKVFASIGLPPREAFTPDRFQTEALAVVEHTDCLVTAPTGAGKTWIAEQAIGRIREREGHARYACPLKALSNAKYTEFSKIFGAHNVGILTGDRRENPEAPIIIGTTEILRNQLYDAMHQGESLPTDFVVLDEVHFLGDAEQGVVWEEIMIYLPKRIPLLMLSATIGNAGQISAWLASIRSKPCTVIAEGIRPVPLFSLFLRPDGTLLPFTKRAKGAGQPQLDKKIAQFINTRRRRTIGYRRKLPPYP